MATRPVPGGDGPHTWARGWRSAGPAPRFPTFGDLVHGATGDGRRLVLLDHVRARLGRGVAMFDEEPLWATVVATPRSDQHPGSFQPLALQQNLEIPLRVAASERVHRVTLVLAAVGVGPPVPHHHGAAAVLSLRNGALEGVVFDRMVFHLHRQPLHRRVETGSLGDGPALHDAIEFEPEVEMEMARRVLLDHV